MLLKKGQISVELEVRPRYLVPDTNCFIDHLPRLQRLIVPESNPPYTLVVPLVGESLIYIFLPLEFFRFMSNVYLDVSYCACA